MKNKKLIAMFLFSSVITLIFLESCSILGAAIGASKDAKSPDELTFTNEELKSIRTGKKTRIYLHSGTTYTGEFLGLESIPEEKYVLKYAEARENIMNETKLPAIGDTLKFLAYPNINYPERGTQFGGEFIEFDYGYIFISTEGKHEIMPVKLKEIIKLENNRGEMLDIKSIQKLSSKGDIPYKSTMDIMSGDIIMNIPLEEIEKLAVKNFKGKETLIGLGAGLLLDALVVGTFVIISIGTPMSLNVGF